LEDADASEEEMDEADYMKGFQLDIDKMVYDEILVNWPMKVLCREDCKGICKKLQGLWRLRLQIQILHPTMLL